MKGDREKYPKACPINTRNIMLNSMQIKTSIVATLKLTLF